MCGTESHLRYLRVSLAGISLSVLVATALLAEAISADAIQHRERTTPNQGTETQSKQTGESKNKAELKGEGSSLKPRPSEQGNEETLAATERKKQLMASLLEGVLASAHRITPVEYGLVVKVEAATLLWESDRDRAQAVLKKAWDGMRELLEEKKSGDARPSRKLQKLRFAVLRRMARLDPGLLNQLAPDSSTGDIKPVTVLGKWTDEARAIISVAQEQVDSNPALAAQLAQRSLPFGLVDWVPFLDKLSQRDSALAEQVAATLMAQFANGPVSPIELLRLDRFVLAPNRSPQLREQFFQVLEMRCMQGLRPDASTEVLRIGSQTAQRALGMATGRLWPAKFQELIFQYDFLLSSRSAGPTPALQTKLVDTSMMNPAKAGDTAEIEEASQRAQRTSDSKGRDKEYQRLAAAAASKENLSLAEELMSRIEDDGIRREATLGVYGPIVRKDLSEGDWTKAQTDALKISYPIGRTLVLDIVAQMILRSGKAKKDEILDVYDTALWKLGRDGSTEDVAKGFLVLAKSLGPIDADRSLEAVNSVIFVLNKLTKGADWLADSETSGALASWVSLPIPTVRYDEVLELTEMIGPLFKEMTKRDPSKAESTAYELAHLGLSSLAQLGIVSELQKELHASARPVPEASSKRKSPVRP
jgi:hypothetical protein